MTGKLGHLLENIFRPPDKSAFADPEISVRVILIFFKSFNVFHRRQYGPPLRGYWTRWVQLPLDWGSIPVFLRKHIATCDFRRIPDPVDPPMECVTESLNVPLHLNIGITHGFSCINICQAPGEAV